MSIKNGKYCVDFVIGGVQKAGTTALARYMIQHPLIFLPSNKELHLFRSSEGLQHAERNMLKFFKTAKPEQLWGDATPIYLYWPSALTMMAEHNPQMKIILSFRHPALRAYSAWSMERKRGRETLSFSRAIREGRQRVREAENGIHNIYSYVERGFYGAQLRRLRSLFPPEQIFCIRSDDISPQRPRLKDLYKFLEVSVDLPETIDHNIFPATPHIHAASLANDLDYLTQMFKDDLADFETLSGLSVTDWSETPVDKIGRDWQHS